MTIGFRVLNRVRKADSSWVKHYQNLPVANVSDSMNRMTSGGVALRPMHKKGYLCGPALTVKARPGDNLMLHYAIDIAEPGDVIVVDAGGDLSNALIGEMMIAYAIKRGVAGIVINGAIRDSAVIGQGIFLYLQLVFHTVDHIKMVLVKLMCLSLLMVWSLNQVI